jgi:hypothetical protein
MELKRSLYRTLIPQLVRQKLYNMHLREIRDADSRARAVLDESVPEAAMSPQYIRQLRVVIDKSALVCELPTEAVVALVGVSDPVLARQLLVATRPNRLHLIDSWTGPYGMQHLSMIRAFFAEDIHKGIVLINSGLPIEEIAQLPDAYLDWAYLNCGFSYEETNAFLEVCRSKVKEAGFIAGSNYGRGSWVTNERFGVVEAVNRFCKERQWEMRYLTHETDRLLGYAITRISHSQKAESDAEHSI